MANFVDSPNYEVYDDYYTPKSAWENINHLIPKDKVIWEACLLNSFQSKSVEYLRELGNNVVGDTALDILKDKPLQSDMIITNIPFDRKIKLPILKRLVEIDKPFIIIMNSLNMYAKYMREIFKGNFQHLQVITPDSKINYLKLNPDGTLTETKKCSFYSVYLCYKMNLNPEDLWLGK